MSELINKLEEKELVSREKDMEDKRLSNIMLTKKGKDFLKKKEDIKEKDVFKILNKEEIDGGDIITATPNLRSTGEVVALTVWSDL